MLSKVIDSSTDVGRSSASRHVSVREPYSVSEDTNSATDAVLLSSRPGLGLEDPRGHPMKVLALALAPQVLALVLGRVMFVTSLTLHVDCGCVKRKFDAACNAVLADCKNANEFVKLHLVKSSCLPLLTYCISSLDLLGYNDCTERLYRFPSAVTKDFPKRIVPTYTKLCTR